MKKSRQVQGLDFVAVGKQGKTRSTIDVGKQGKNKKGSVDIISKITYEMTVLILVLIIGSFAISRGEIELAESLCAPRFTGESDHIST